VHRPRRTLMPLRRRCTRKCDRGRPLIERIARRCERT
jgi:hypothetical protein